MWLGFKGKLILNGSFNSLYTGNKSFDIIQCYAYCIIVKHLNNKGSHGRDRMVVEFTTTCSWRGILNTTLCDKVCQWLATGWWFSRGTPVSSTNNTDRHDITEILLKVVLNIINLNLNNKKHFLLLAVVGIITYQTFCLWKSILAFISVHFIDNYLYPSWVINNISETGLIKAELFGVFFTTNKLVNCICFKFFAATI